MVDLTRIMIPDEALDHIIGELATFGGDRAQLHSDIFVAQMTYRQMAWERENGVPSGQMYRKSVDALKALRKAQAHLIAAHSCKDEDDVPQPQPEPWFERIESVLADEINFLEAAISSGGPTRGAPRKSEFISFVQDLAEIYTRITGKEPTSTRSSPEHSRLSRPPEFHRFVIACLENADPRKANQPTIDASIFEALRHGPSNPDMSSPTFSAIPD